MYLTLAIIQVTALIAYTILVGTGIMENKWWRNSVITTFLLLNVSLVFYVGHWLIGIIFSAIWIIAEMRNNYQNRNVKTAFNVYELADSIMAFSMITRTEFYNELLDREKTLNAEKDNA